MSLVLATMAALEQGATKGITVKRIISTLIAGALAVGLMSPRPVISFSEEDKSTEEAQQAYKAYVKAWKLKDLMALENLISENYMAVNFEGKVSDKANEITTAREDAEWNSMSVDEIHTRIFGSTAIASGFISAQGRRKDGGIFNAKVRFLAVLVKRDGIWQLVATQSSSFKPAN